MWQDIKEARGKIIKNVHAMQKSVLVDIFIGCVWLVSLKTCWLLYTVDKPHCGIYVPELNIYMKPLDDEPGRKSKREEREGGRAWASWPATNCCPLLSFHFMVKCGLNGWYNMVVASVSMTQAAISPPCLGKKKKKNRKWPFLKSRANSSICV